MFSLLGRGGLPVIHLGVLVLGRLHWLKVRSEYVETIFSCRCYQALVLGVEPKLFHLVLTLVQEHHLGWNLHVKLLIDFLGLICFIDFD